MNNVVDTVRQEAEKKGREEGEKKGREEGEKKGQSNMLLRLLPRTVGGLSDEITTQINQLSLEKLDLLIETFLDFSDLDDLRNWLNEN